MSYKPNPVNFDGTNDYLTRGAGLTGGADSKLMTTSFWFKANVDNTTLRIARGTSTAGGSTARGISFLRGPSGVGTGSNSVGVNAFGTGGTIVFQTLPTSDQAKVAAGWQHFMVSVDVSDTGKRHFYLNDADGGATWPDYNNAVIDFTTGDTAIGAAPDGTNKLNGDLADFMVWAGVYLDLSVVANRRLFISAAIEPVNPQVAIDLLGTPLIAFHGDTASWHTNKGSGGGFTENGALADGATPLPYTASDWRVPDLRHPRSKPEMIGY